MPYLAVLINSLKNSRSRCGWLPKFNQFFLVQRNFSGKIFTKFWSV